MVLRVKTLVEVSLGIDAAVEDVVVIVVGNVVAGVGDVMRMKRHRGVGWEGRRKTTAMRH